ncbi:HlyD family efflux transporter periplasmic adaptor subunit [Ancylomarina euxinus]|uniref:HlyD family efflux transporter periplasmic adaptor subunit n=1 Tax=Ancylomarina euxinus TaxID=2283627 RepID=A0A425Y0X0_9BACT|nr:HlyD family efflux transporter periplasmic adaptor subunit [Ancylomarina euxinus]MCZ4693796.1 HlyD family efflux transporter periplasmic adaptor subunit [Ancylomarina euxinus]MUP15124.1 HlyD family efflux transporter periplasmic adaptor subunit [Ancylomarina euxinus]RRG21547.1 HlyD family efflux transporter periplasmic adaptor subunit [Ancylomarina euxinus]
MPGVSNLVNRSERVKAILGQPPRWILRWGITIITSVIILLLLGSYFFRYPDLIVSDITLISSSPPIPVIPKVSGNLDLLFVKDNQVVTKNQILGIIDNPSNYEDICDLKCTIDTLSKILENEKCYSKNIKLKNEYQLGDLFNKYSIFLSQWSRYNLFKEIKYNDAQVEVLNNQINDYLRYLKQLKDQACIFEDDLTIMKDKYKTDSILCQKGVLALSNFSTSRSNYLKQVYAYKGVIANLTNLEIKINNFSQEITTLKLQKKKDNAEILADLKKSLNSLVNEIAIWENKYVLRSSIDGIVTFTHVWSQYQYLSSGSIVFTVVPMNNFQIVGKMRIPMSGSGKVSIGQKVNIKLNNYPYMEFGMLHGKISNISLVPSVDKNGTYYSAEVLMNNNLNTNYKKVLSFHQEMKGVGEIVTRENRLIQRFVDPLRAILFSNVIEQDERD